MSLNKLQNLLTKYTKKMKSRDPRDYYVRIQYSLFKDYDEKGLIAEDVEGPNKTFWLIAYDGSWEQRFSTKSAPKWVMQIYNKIIK